MTELPPNVVTKLVVIVFENHGRRQAEKSMPYLMSLAKKYGYATAYKARTHPSLPNYLAIVSGKTHGIRSNVYPSSAKLTGSTVLSGAIDANRTAKTYADGMPRNAYLKNGGDDYVVRHNPWLYFPGDKEDWSVFDVPYNGIAGPGTNFGVDVKNGNIPNLALIIPNNINNAHDGSLGTADKWLKARMNLILNGEDFKRGNTAIAILFDEDNHKENNNVAFVMVHPHLSGKRVTTALTHYSLTRALADVGHSPRLNNAAKAPDLLKAFGLVPDPGADGRPEDPANLIE
jgi:acid phosphatase